MRFLRSGFRALAAGLLLAFMSNADAVADMAQATQPSGSTPPASAEVDPSAWQTVITGQIEAFRKGDGKAALGFAASAFQKAFADPNTFMISIAASGYAPIFTSVSHSFGKFSQPDAMTAVQVVDLVGPKQEVFEAIYVLTKEAGGWRVSGVELTKINAVNA